MNILVVEDDQKTADLIVRSLQENGYSVTHASDGKMAMELAKKEKFDLAVIDIMLPFADGFTVIETIFFAKPVKRAEPSILTVLLH